MTTPRNFRLDPAKTGLLVIDVQEKLIPLVDHYTEILSVMQKVIKGFQILKLPIFFSEQYPKGLGKTICALSSFVGDEFQPFTKTAFSCLEDAIIKQELMDQKITQWVLVGIEAHVCVLQTAKDLLAAGKEVIVLNDAISSRSLYDFSTAIAEMRDLGIRVTSSETVLFELVKDSKSDSFKGISQLIK